MIVVVTIVFVTVLDVICFVFLLCMMSLTS